LELGKVGGAVVFDAAAQLVVINGIDRLARGGAEVALARALVLFVDALLDFGQGLEQSQPALF